MIETRPVEIAFDSKQKMTGLEIVTGLDAADELADAAIKIVAGKFRLPLVHAPPKLAPT